MATEGPLYPGTVANLSNAGTSESAEAWVNPTNVTSDNATEATITAATYDSPDISQILVCSNFGFSSVAGTINGITVEIDRRSIISGSGADFRVQLANGTTFASLVGSNKAATGTTWPTSSTVATYGGAADTWSSGLTAAQITSSSFAVFVSCSAKIANADVGIDFVRVTVTYTPPTNTTVTPGAASLTTSPSAPTVAVTANQFVTPGAASLATSASAPTVTATDHKTALPGSVSLSLSASAPDVALPVLAAPGAAGLALTASAPDVATTAHVTAAPGAASLTLTADAPAIVTPVGVQPGAAALSLTTEAPEVVNPKTAEPAAASLTLTGAEPQVRAGVSVDPLAAALSITASAPDAAFTDNQLVTPAAATLALTTFAATVLAPVTVAPGSEDLTLSPSAPAVNVGTPGQVWEQPGAAALTLTGAHVRLAIAWRGMRASITSGGVVAVAVESDDDLDSEIESEASVELVFESSPEITASIDSA